MATPCPARWFLFAPYLMRIEHRWNKLYNISISFGKNDAVSDAFTLGWIQSATVNAQKNASRRCLYFFSLISVLGKAVTEDKHEHARHFLWSLSFDFRSDADLMAARDYNAMQCDWNKEPHEECVNILPCCCKKRSQSSGMSHKLVGRFRSGTRKNVCIQRMNFDVLLFFKWAKMMGIKLKD